MKIRLLIFCLLFAVLPVKHLLAYAEAGHKTVGAVADNLLAGKPAGDAVKKWLGNVTLERVATLPDELRGEDKAPGSISLPENPDLLAQLLAFRAANPPNDTDLSHFPPSHHWFHYTDVPIQCSSYAETHKGTSQWDIVHMIGYCVRVLEGKEKPDNDRKITPAIAIVLLTHYLGDIHEPMHVGSAYLNVQGDLLDPNTDSTALEERGGNDINFGAGNLHGYWDYDSVESALSWQRRIQKKSREEFTPAVWGKEIASREPEDWKPDPAWKPEEWAEKWADEILPVAREAHARLQILPRESFDTARDGTEILRWTAVEKPHPGKDSYAVFASKTAEKELNKAGWRLAALLEAVLTPGAN